MKKLRSDSKLAGLSPAARNALAARLQGSCSLAAVCDWLADEHDISISQTSLSEYYKTRVLADQWRRNEAIAQTLKACQSAAVADAAHAAVAQKAYTLATANDCDTKLLIDIYKLLLASENTRQDARKLALLEAKAAAADAAKDTLTDKSLTREDREAKIKRIFGIA